MARGGTIRGCPRALERAIEQPLAGLRVWRSIGAGLISENEPDPLNAAQGSEPDRDGGKTATAGAVAPTGTACNRADAIA